MRYAEGEHIIRQGEKGDTLYIIKHGSARVTHNNSSEGGGEPVFIRMMSSGSYFGEKALVGDSMRTANVVSYGTEGCTCIVIDKQSFSHLEKWFVKNGF